jgi:hypothetical protein
MILARWFLWAAQNKTRMNRRVKRGFVSCEPIPVRRQANGRFYARISTRLSLFKPFASGWKLSLECSLLPGEAGVRRSPQPDGICRMQDLVEMPVRLSLRLPVSIRRGRARRIM